MRINLLTQRGRYYKLKQWPCWCHWGLVTAAPPARAWIWPRSHATGFGAGGLPPGFGPPNQLGILFRAAEVQQELELTQAQKKEVEKALADEAKEMQAGFQRFNPAEMRDLEPAEREKRFEQMQSRMTKLSQDTRTKLDKLLQPAELERLDQLVRQREAGRRSCARRRKAARAFGRATTKAARLGGRSASFFGLGGGSETAGDFRVGRTVRRPAIRMDATQGCGFQISGVGFASGVSWRRPGWTDATGEAVDQAI